MSSDASKLVVDLTREIDSARSAVLDVANHFNGDDFIDNVTMACNPANDLAGALARAHNCAFFLLLRFGGDPDLYSLLARSYGDAEMLLENLHTFRESVATAASDAVEERHSYVDLAVRDTEMLAQSIELAASALMKVRYPLGGLRPETDVVNESSELNAGSTKRQNRPPRAARHLARVATRVLPSAHRHRYEEEYQSELYELAAAGASWRAQLMYAIRLVDRAWVLRAELCETALNRSRP